MKILYFTNLPAPYRVEFFNLLSKNNDVTVLFDCVKDDRNKNWYNENVYNFKTIKLQKFALFQLKKIIKEHYDIIVIGTYASINGAILCTILEKKKIKFIINADGGFVPKKEMKLSRILKKYFISKADYYLSSGKETNKYLEYYGAKSENIYIYPFTSLLNDDILSSPINYSEKKLLRNKKGLNYQRLFISVGSFIYRKGYDIFLESIKDLGTKNIGFIVIGGGSEYNKYSDYLKEKNITNVHFIDFCSKKEIFDFYKMSDVFFFPSREDIWGLVINEAMANGLPVISSDKVLSSLELLDKNCIYECDDTAQLKNKILEYSRMSEVELNNLGKKNLSIIKNYTIENMTKIHLDIFNKILEKEKIYEDK